MADIEIRNIPITSTAPATDDYTILDGDSNGTRKINLKGQLDANADLTGATFTGNVSATNLSGTNTGDETKASIENKLGVNIDLNTFNGNSQLVQTTADGKYPALDGSLITGVGATVALKISALGTVSSNITLDTNTVTTADGLQIKGLYSSMTYMELTERVVDFIKYMELQVGLQISQYQRQLETQINACQGIEEIDKIEIDFGKF